MINLLEAASASTVLESALLYLEAGISVIPVQGKKPPVLANGLNFSWARFQTERAPFSYVHNWHNRGWLSGVGVVCGEVSNNLVVIDLDGLEAVQEFRRCWPDLLDTYTVRSGSGRGEHIYLHVLELPPTTRTQATPFGGFELRANGCYVVAPPSLHPSGNPYTISNPQPVKTVDNLDDVSRWIRRFIMQAQPQPVQAQQPQPRAAGYVGAAVAGETNRVWSSSPDNHNNMLNKAAFNLGKFVNSGQLSEQDVINALLPAALACGQSEREALATIRSGLAGAARKGKLPQ